MHFYYFGLLQSNVDWECLTLTRRQRLVIRVSLVFDHFDHLYYLVLSFSPLLPFYIFFVTKSIVAILTSLPPPFFIDCLSFYLAKKKQTQKYICTWINDSTVNWLEANHLHYYLSLLHKMYVEILKFMALGTWTSKKMKLNQFW